MRTSAKVLTAVSISLTMFGVSCGGDDPGFGASTSSDEEFCAKVAAVEDMNPSADDMADVVATIEELASEAPSDELRDAMLTLVPVMNELENLDENDPDAMSKVMELMMDPQVVAAGELIEKFSSETCGFEESNDETDGSGSADTMPTEGGGDYIFDNMEAGDISDYVAAFGSDYYPNGYVGSSSMSSAGEYTEVVIDFVDADSVDGVALCEVVVEGIAMSTTDTAVRIVIQENAVDVAVREVDGECTAV